jgi:hypothetical protein
MKSLLLFALACFPLKGIVIKVDYRYDIEGFFENPAAKAVIEAAAARWSRIIDQTLLPVNMQDETFVDGRFQIIHPGTGEDYVLSAAASHSSDFYVQAGQRRADEYLGGFSLEEDVWVLFVGARSLKAAARGGPISGAGNLALVYSDPESFVNRGFNSGVNSLTVLGGTVSFDLEQNWSFDLANPPGEGTLDFYSVALHEIGHGLGLNARSVAEFRGLITGNRFVGPNAVSALEADTGISVHGLEIVSPSAKDYHWQDNEYDSKIFPFGTPLLFGTVGAGNLQDLLMEPAFTVNGVVTRREVTNVDAAALKDIGWSIVSGNPPRSPELPIEIGTSSNGGISMQLMSEVGAIYTVQTSPDGCSWVSVIPSLTGDGGLISWSDGQEGTYDPFGPASELEGKYYRVIKN